MTDFSAADRRALWSVAAQFFVNGAVFASFLPRLPEIRDRVGVTVDRIGLLLSLAGAAGLVGSLLVGRVIDRFGTRRVLLVGGSALALSLLVVGAARSPLVLLAGLVLLALFDVLVDVAMNLQGSWLSARRHAPVMSRLHGLWSLGTVVGGVASWLLATGGVPVGVHVVGATAVLLVALVYVGRGLLPVDEHDDRAASADAAPVDQAGSPAGGATPGRTVEPVLDRALRPGRLALVALAAAGFSALAVEGTSIDWAAFRMADDHRFSAGAAALGYVAVAGGMTVGRLAGDWATVRLGPAGLGRLAAGASGVGLAAATLVDRPWLNLAGFVVAGLGIATMLPAIYDRAARQPGRPGSGLGALTAGLRVAALAIPLAVGGLAATSLSVGSAMAIVTLPAVVGFAAISRLLATP